MKVVYGSSLPLSCLFSSELLVPRPLGRPPSFPPLPALPNPRCELLMESDSIPGIVFAIPCQEEASGTSQWDQPGAEDDNIEPNYITLNYSNYS